MMLCEQICAHLLASCGVVTIGNYYRSEHAEADELRKFETSKTRVEGRKLKIDDFAYSRLALGFPKWYSTCL